MRFLSGAMLACFVLAPRVAAAHDAEQPHPSGTLAPDRLMGMAEFGLGWLVYHEEMTTTRIVGFALIWTALLLLTVEAVRRSRGTATSEQSSAR